jgi:hypothetical protein
MNDLACYHEPQANSIFVDLPVLRFNETKELKKLGLIFFFNANSGVRHSYFQIFLNRIVFYFDFSVNCYAAIFGEFQRVTLKTKQNLHNTLLIGKNVWREVAEVFTASI